MKNIIEIVLYVLGCFLIVIVYTIFALILSLIVFWPIVLLVGLAFSVM